MRLKSWGLIESDSPDPLCLSNRFAACEDVRAGGFSLERPATLHAGGRSYSDLALPSARSRAILTGGMSNIVSFCRETGVMEVESGATLAQIQKLALTAGWGLSVIPGTAKATAGGAFANDVHGKNHGKRGAFSRSVLKVCLMRSDLGLIDLDRKSAELWAATVGGMGATGLILTLTLQLVRWPSSCIVFSQTRFTGIQEFLDLSNDADEEHVVGWVDALRSPIRGILFKGDASPTDEADQGRHWAQAMRELPLPTAKMITATTTRAFNWAYWRAHANTANIIRGWESFFCPLDKLNGWNQLYGASGLSQFQCVVPTTHAVAALNEMFELCRRRSQGSFLAVIKKFGDLASEGWMSFARPGVTFAMDFANGPDTQRLLAELSAIALECGGGLYPAKMQFANAADLTQSFPDWRRWRACWDESYGNLGSAWMARNLGASIRAPQGTSNER